MKTIALANHKGGCAKTTTTRRCFRCNVEKPLSDFHKNRHYALGHSYECKACKSQRMRRLYQAERDYIAVAHKACSKCGLSKGIEDFKTNRRSVDGHTNLCRACIIQNHKAWRRATKLKIFNALGGCCACCGESTYEFLSIDHIHGGGKKHRESLENDQARFYREVLNEGVPADKYRVLCHNCNQALGAYGYCPHASQVKVA